MKQGRNKDNISVTLDKNVLEVIDEKRGDMHRSTYINSLLKKAVMAEA